MICQAPVSMRTLQQVNIAARSVQIRQIQLLLPPKALHTPAVHNQFKVSFIFLQLALVLTDVLTDQTNHQAE